MVVGQNDVKENEIKELDPKILSILLRDKTTRKNIIWATDDYQVYGDGYGFSDEIIPELITGELGNVIKPRVEKSKEEQTARSKGKAEVFTPSWVCNKQNNLVDNAWFGYENIFNVETSEGWITNETKIVFPNTDKKTWKDYVNANRLEISCGEAPYLASRYDTVTGEVIPVKSRIGMLDRKLRVVSENTDDEKTWVEWAIKAVQRIYGYDWQGDNVLLARENILFTFGEHYEERFGIQPSKEVLKNIAKIVAWNIWQMDGIKYVVPNSCHDEVDPQLRLDGQVITNPCPGCTMNNHSKHNGIYARTYDWVAQHSVVFRSFIDPAFRRKK